MTACYGHEVRINDATVEAFLAIYDDSDRYPGDSHQQRRNDVKSASRRIRLRPNGRGGVFLTAVRTSELGEPSLLAFLEIYERNRPHLTRGETLQAIERLKRALPMLVGKVDGGSAE